jgi:hypothetical protein
MNAAKIRFIPENINLEESGFHFNSFGKLLKYGPESSQYSEIVTLDTQGRLPMRIMPNRWQDISSNKFLSIETAEHLTEITTSTALAPGTYRATFDAEFTVTSKPCECSILLTGLKTKLKTYISLPEYIFPVKFKIPLKPGKYISDSAVAHAESITLDGNGDKDAIFIFLINAAYTPTAETPILLINNAQACNVYWVVKGAINFAASCKSIIGIYISDAAIAFVSCVLDGRMFTTGGAIAITGKLTTVTSENSSYFDLGTLSTMRLYSVAGAISITVQYISIDGLRVETNLGIVTGFGDFDGSYPTTVNTIPVQVSFCIYVGEVAILNSLRTMSTLPGLRGYISTASNAITNSEAISIRMKMDNNGIVNLGNRTLFILPLFAE